MTLMLLTIILLSNSLLTEASDVVRPDKVLELTSDNYDAETSRYQIVVLNFYADWCPYSAIWKPTFQDTAKVIYNQTSSLDPGTIVFGQINCQIETTLAQRFRITKFPTTKLTLNGRALKKEYRGARNSAAFQEFLENFLKDPIVYITSVSDLANKIEESNGALIMYSKRPDEQQLTKAAESIELSTYRRVAQQYREDCQFIYVTSSASVNKVQDPNMYSLVFKPHHKGLDTEEPYSSPSSLADFNALASWAQQKCNPLVREITFQNAEELTEEGLPFVILFYKPNDKTWIEIYKRVIEQELSQEASGVTFLYADGHVFSHPLKHLGKTVDDLPVVAIDSFKHLFLYKEPITHISKPGNLKRFIGDLHSGKLDREFHYGPDPTSPDSATSPPESAFNKLAPSAYRYTFVNPRDEL